MTLLLKLLSQESCAQDEGCVLLPLRLQITCDLQDILTVKPGYLFGEWILCYNHNNVRNYIFINISRM